MRLGRSVAMGLVVATLVSSLPARISAQSPADAHEVRASLWLPRDLSSREDEGLRAAWARATDEPLITPSEARARLVTVASALPEDPTERDARAALREVREAYVELRLDEARRATERVLERAVASEQSPASPELLADAFFARALVSLAAQRRDDAERDLIAVLTLVPSFAPDPAEYGPPVLRALDRARRVASRRSARPLRVRIDRAPEDAIVRLDGHVVEPGAVALVDRPGAHLLVAERAGYAPRSQWVSVGTSEEARAAVVLSRAPVPLVARHALAQWPEGAALAPGSETARLVAIALDLRRIVSAERATADRDPTAAVDGDIALVAYDASTAVVTRRARGPAPTGPGSIGVVGAFLGRAGDATTSVVPSASLTVTAPSQITTRSPLVIEATLRDPGRSVATLEARCGARRSRASRRPRGDVWRVALRMASPRSGGVVECRLFAFDGEHSAVLRAPEGAAPLRVRVATVESTPWITRWYVWAIIGVAAAGGAIAGIAAASGDEPDRQVLVVRGPE